MSQVIAPEVFSGSQTWFKAQGGFQQMQLIRGLSFPYFYSALIVRISITHLLQTISNMNKNPNDKHQAAQTVSDDEEDEWPVAQQSEDGGCVGVLLRWDAASCCLGLSWRKFRTLLKN